MSVARPEDPASAVDVVVIVESVPLFALGLEHLVRGWRRAASIWQRRSWTSGRRMGEPPMSSWTLVVVGPGIVADPGAPESFPVGLRVPVLVAADPRLRVPFPAFLQRGVTSMWDATSAEAGFACAADAAILGEEWISPTLSGPLVRSVGSRLSQMQVGAASTLTDREREILALLARGASNRGIAEALFISENTVKNHVRSILDKLQATSRTEAVVLAAQAGLVDIGGRPG